MDERTFSFVNWSMSVNVEIVLLCEFVEKNLPNLLIYLRVLSHVHPYKNDKRCLNVRKIFVPIQFTTVKGITANLKSAEHPFRFYISYITLITLQAFQEQFKVDTSDFFFWIRRWKRGFIVQICGTYIYR